MRSSAVAGLVPVQFEGPAGRLAGWVREGSAPQAVPVLFMHPINTQGRIWETLLQEMPDDRTAYLPDLRGHGTSGAEGPFGLDEWLSDYLAFLEHVGETGPVHVVGGSLGGSLAVCLAEARPGQVMSIAGIGSSLNFEGANADAVIEMFDTYGIPGTFEKVFPEITFGPYVRPEVIAQGLALANHNDVEIVKQIWTATVYSDSTPRARAVTCPALVVTGEYDGTCTPALGLAMARALGTEQVLMPDIGHMPMLESPRRLSELLLVHFSRAETLASAGRPR